MIPYTLTVPVPLGPCSVFKRLPTGKMDISPWITRSHPVLVFSMLIKLGLLLRWVRSKKSSLGTDGDINVRGPTQQLKETTNWSRKGKNHSMGGLLDGWVLKYLRSKFRCQGEMSKVTWTTVELWVLSSLGSLKSLFWWVSTSKLGRSFFFSSLE